MTQSGRTVATRAVCVTGMHRSGTSVVAGTLGLIGASLGRADRMLPPGADNPKGYSEIKEIVQLDDELFAHLGGAWDQPPVLDPGWESDPGLGPFRERAVVILDDVFGPAEERPPVIAWKDPRLSL